MCNQFGPTGHWGKCLDHSDKKSVKRSWKKNINYLAQNEVTDEFEKYTFGVINIDSHFNIKDWTLTDAYTVIKIEPYSRKTTNLRGKVDIGATGNIL